MNEAVPGVRGAPRGRRGLVAALALAAGLVAVAGGLPGTAGATTIVVDDFGDGGLGSGTCTLRNAVVAANTNFAAGGCPAGEALPEVDEIVLSAGTYTYATGGGVSTCSPSLEGTAGHFRIREDVLIRGAGMNDTIIQPVVSGDVRRAFWIGCGASGVVAELRDLRIQNTYLRASYGHGGAAIRNTTADLTLTRVRLHNNHLRKNGARGAAVYSRNAGSVVRIVDSDFSYNVAEDAPQCCTDLIGAGIYTYQSDLYIDGTTFRNNAAEGDGADIHFDSGGLGPDLVITNSTFSDATGLSSVYVTGTGTQRLLENVTISGTITAYEAEGGAPATLRHVYLRTTVSRGIVAYRGGVTSISNSVIDGSGCWSTSLDSGGGNVQSPSDNCSLDDPSDQVSVPDLMVGPLADNGGRTSTFLPEIGSPVVDVALAGDCTPTDQRGFSRPFDGDGDGGSECDAGPVEVGFTINGADVYTPSVDVTLQMPGAGSSTEMNVSNTGFGGGTWVPFESIHDWTLLAGTGEKTVYAQFRDPAEPAEVYEASDTIILDESDPVVDSFQVDDLGPGFADLSWTASDPDSGITGYEYAVGTPTGGDTWISGGWLDAALFESITFPAPFPFLFEPDTPYKFSLRPTNGATRQTVASVVEQYDSLGFSSQTLVNGDVTGPVFMAEFVVTLDEGDSIVGGTEVVKLDAELHPFLVDWDPGTRTFTITIDFNGLELGNHVLEIEADASLGNKVNQALSFLVSDPSVLVVNPSFTVLDPAETLLYTGVGGDPGPLTWSLECGDLGADCGSLVDAPDGRSTTLTAGADPGTYSLSAVDAVGRSDTVGFTIDGSVQLSPTTVTVGKGLQQVFEAEGGTPPYTWLASGGTGVASGTNDETFTYTAGSDGGAFAVQVEDAVGATYNATVVIVGDAGRAIIVGGGGSVATNPLLFETQFLTRFAYKSFNVKGLGRDDIQYLTPLVSTADACGGATPHLPAYDGDADGDPCNDVDAEATQANLADAITNWAPNVAGVGPDVPLWIYLMDHGLIDEFLLNQTCLTEGCNDPGDVVSAGELAGWLAQLETLAPGTPVYIVYDACHAGSFADDVGGPNRIFLASTREPQLSYYSANGSASFSGFLFSNLISGLSLQESFLAAAQGLPAAWPQTPGLDDDGDGALSGFLDGQVAKDVYLGAIAGGSPLPLVLGSTPSQTLSPQEAIQLSARVSSAQPPGRVWVSMIDPADPLVVEEFTLFLADDPLTPEYEYEWIFPGFTTIGDWTLMFFAQVEDVSSLPRTITVTVTTGCSQVGGPGELGGILVAGLLLPLALRRRSRAGSHAQGGT